MKRLLAPIIKYRNRYAVFFMLYAIFFSNIIFRYGSFEKNVMNILVIQIIIPLLVPVIHLFIVKLTSTSRTV